MDLDHVDYLDEAVACEFCGGEALSLERAPSPCVRCGEPACVACMVQPAMICLECLKPEARIA